MTSPTPALAKLLTSVRCRFIAYGFGREGQEGNVLFKKPSLEGFFSDLISARAIIANSGFSLVTEALHLGKPYLAVPVSHQFEQIFNAYWLEKSGLRSLLGRLEQRARRIVSLQFAALSRVFGEVSATGQSSTARQARLPDFRHSQGLGDARARERK